MSVPHAKIIHTQLSSIKGNYNYYCGTDSIINPMRVYYITMEPLDDFWHAMSKVKLSSWKWLHITSSSFFIYYLFLHTCINISWSCNLRHQKLCLLQTSYYKTFLLYWHHLVQTTTALNNLKAIMTGAYKDKEKTEGPFRTQWLNKLQRKHSAKKCGTIRRGKVVVIHGQSEWVYL